MRAARLLATIALLHGADQSAAQDSASLTIYGWLPSIDGSTQDNDADPLYEVEAESVLDALEMAAFAAGEIWRGDLGLMFDFAYVDLSSDVRLRNGPDLGLVDTDAETKAAFASVALARNLWRKPASSVDLYAGLRGYWVEAVANADLRLGARASADFSTAGDVTWLDPFLGVRAVVPVTDRWSLSGRADLGGFGLGSDLTWQALGVANFAATEALSLSLGYRYMSIDYQKGPVLDLDLYGPVVGLTFRF